MPTEHVNIADGERHEPKGASTATVGEIWQSDGAGSGSHKQPTVAITKEVSNIGGGGTLGYICVPFDCEVETIYSVIDGALSTADDQLNFFINLVQITGVITVTESGSAAGDVDSVNPTANKTANAGDYIRISSNGTSSGTVNATITFLLRGV